MKITKNDEILLKEKYKDNYKEIQKKINNNYPIQYLIGNVNFYGYNINVNENVLIPRFETELLIEKTLFYLKKYNINNPNVLDIGTGSGCIAITIAKEIQSKVTAIDINEKALELASLNAKENQVDITFIKKDILKESIDESYDLIISNPPYLTKEDIVGKEIAYEPQNALYADNSGTIFYKKILEKSKGKLNKKSLIAFETGINQVEQLKEIINNYYPDAKVIFEQDYTNRNRYVFIVNE